VALSITVEFIRILAYSDCLGAPAVGFIALKISTKHLVTSKLFLKKISLLSMLVSTLSLLRRPTVAVST
jgi:hypothetical protein